MKELIGIAALIATLYGGTVVGGKILKSVRTAALAKAAEGVPPLASFSGQLTTPKATSTSNRKERCK